MTYNIRLGFSAVERLIFEVSSTQLSSLFQLFYYREMTNISFRYCVPIPHP
jgi:hypothetical protein